MRELNKKQLERIIHHSIRCQERISERNDGHDSFNNAQFNYFKKLYKTAFHYFCGESGYVVDGIAMLDYKELLEMNDILEKGL